MNLFGSGRTACYFAKAELKRNRDGDRVASIVLKIKLDGQRVRSTPVFIRDSYQACKGQQSEAQIDAAIEVQNVDFSALPDKTSKPFALKAVVFDHLRMRKSKESDIYLYMRASVTLNDRLGKWILDSYGTELWAAFEDAQGKLLEDLEPDEEGEEEEPEEEGEPGEAAAAGE